MAVRGDGRRVGSAQTLDPGRHVMGFSGLGVDAGQQPGLFLVVVKPPVREQRRRDVRRILLMGPEHMPAPGQIAPTRQIEGTDKCSPKTAGDIRHAVRRHRRGTGPHGLPAAAP